jgi:hypothetical protein
MREVKITCICRGIKLPDLGLDLVQGQSAIVAETAVWKSKDLIRASVGIRVEYVERYQKLRDPAEPLPVGRVKKPRRLP